MYTWKRTKQAFGALAIGLRADNKLKTIYCCKLPRVSGKNNRSYSQPSYMKLYLSSTYQLRE